VIRRAAGIAMVGWLVVGLAGCGSGLLGLSPVSGKVTYNGEPLDGATVTFVAADGGVATGITDAQGTFTLITGANAGAAKGSYKVTIRKVAEREVPEGMKGETDPTKMMSMMMKGKSIPEPSSLIPARYGDPNASGLTAEVTGRAAADNFTFELTD
jgi:hypothetical protein